MRYAICPKCSRRMEQSGVLTIEDVALPTFECPECIVHHNLYGTELEYPAMYAEQDGSLFPIGPNE